MAHPGWCVVEEAHSDEDCHREMKVGEQCRAAVWQGYSRYPCYKPAKGWRRMFITNTMGQERTLPACGIHMRSNMPGSLG